MLSFLSNLVWHNGVPKRSYGWRKDTYNEQVLAARPEMKTFKTFIKHPLLESIKMIDLRSKFPPVYDQGQLGSCVFNACDGAYGFEMMKQGEPYVSMSRLFMYYNTRVAEGTVDQDSGAEIKDAVYQIGSYDDAHGTCTEELWPYDITKFTVKPTDECYTNAKFHHVVKAERIQQDLTDLKQSLLDGYPVIFGFQVYESFESETVAKTGKMPMPAPGEKLLGGHGVVLAGFDDTQSVFIVRNSWGTNWGDAGYFYMPYDFIVKPDYASDFWSIRLVEDQTESVSVSKPESRGSISYYTHYSPFNAPLSPTSSYTTDFDSDIDDEFPLPALKSDNTTKQNTVFNETLKNIINKEFGAEKQEPKYVSALDTTSHQIRVLLDDIYAKRIDTNKRMNQLKQAAFEASQIAQLKETAVSVAEAVLASADTNVAEENNSESDNDKI